MYAGIKQSCVCTKRELCFQEYSSFLFAQNPAETCIFMRF